MRSESTSALAHPRLTKPTAGARGVSPGVPPVWLAVDLTMDMGACGGAREPVGDRHPASTMGVYDSTAASLTGRCVAFDRDYCQRFYFNPRTAVTSRAEMRAPARLIVACAGYVGLAGALHRR